MGKRKRKLPTVEEILSRPWCYYCERDFDDIKILINHQKARHFKCNKCNRRLHTAGGLAVHLSQVHKDQLNEIENALPNRKGLDVEIFGMEGIPEETSGAHRKRMIEQFYENQADRARNTGNPTPGSGQEVVRKKPRTETHEELDKRLEDWIEKRKEFKANGGVDPMMGVQSTAPPQFQQQAPPSGPPGYPMQAQGPPGAAYQQPPYGMPAQQHLPPGMSGGLPQRPQGDLGPSIDDLISGAAADAQKATATPPADPRKAGGKKKKEENVRLVYSDEKTSPEERMAAMSKYAYTPDQTEEKVLQSLSEPGAAGITGTADEDIVPTG